MALTIRSIPQRYQAGFAKIMKLSPEAVTALVEALEKSRFPSASKEMLSSVSEQVTILKKEDVEDIVRTLYSLYDFLVDSDASILEFVSDLISAMRASGKESLAISEEETIEFREKLTKLLSLQTPTIVSKVENLKEDYTNIFHDVKTLTDIRPIFAEPGERPVGAAVVHTLKIVYHESGEHREFYVALDADDIQRMVKILKRAEVKGASLKSFLKSANLQDLS